MIAECLRSLGEAGAAGLYEEPDRSLFYRKALGLRRYFETCPLPPFRGTRLYPSGNVWTPHYLDGMPLDLAALEQKDADLAARIRGDFLRYRSSVPEEHTVAGNMYTHSMPHYERVLREGFSSYRTRIAEIGDLDLREGLLHLTDGIGAYAARCADLVSSSGGNTALAAALRRVPMEPARDFYEAVVGWNLLLYLDHCDNLGCVASGLSFWWKGEDAMELLGELFDNLDANDGYSMAIGTDSGPLALQCLEASRGRRRPMIELFVDEDTPAEIWEKAFQVVRSANGQPAFYNPKALLGGLMRRFPVLREEDARRFCGGGCTEAMIAGLSCVGSLDAGINLPLLLERCLYADLASSRDFEDFLSRYLSSVSDTVDAVTREISASQARRAELMPLPMRTLLVDDCIEKGLDFNNGGARYMWSVVNFAGLVNVVDSLLVVRDFIFRERRYAPEAFLEKLRSSDAAFLSEARLHPVCFGRDDSEANALAGRVSSAVFSLLDDRKPHFGEGFLPASIQFNTQAAAGRHVGATPDGRAAGTPLCDSLGAIFGKDERGPTALLNSVTSLDLGRALGVPVLNFNVKPDFRDDVLRALILGYMERGGIQMQITCVSREMLEDALRRPELHRNLVVRVGGYSEYFCRLTGDLQQMILNRTIQNET